MLQRQRARLAYYLVLPAMTLVVLLNLVPLLQGLVVIVQNQNLIRPNPTGFVGLRHYARALTVDADFWGSCLASVYFTACAVAGAYLLSLGFALLLNSTSWARLFRALFLIPWGGARRRHCAALEVVLLGPVRIRNFALIKFG